MVLILFSGCSNAVTQDQLKIETYQTYYTDIFNATLFKTSSDYYSIAVSSNDLGNSSYRYDVIIDQPKVAMYDIHILLIQDDGSLVISKTMMPSIGVFEDITYYMIPNQINADAHYVKGFNLNGLSSTIPIHLKMLVSWKNALNKTSKEYFEFMLDVIPPTQ